MGDEGEKERKRPRTRLGVSVATRAGANLSVMSLGKVACVLICLGHVALFATPWTAAHQAPLSKGFPRQGYWSGLPFPMPGDLPDPGIKPTSHASPALAGSFPTTAPPVRHRFVLLNFSPSTTCSPCNFLQFGLWKLHFPISFTPNLQNDLLRAHPICNSSIYHIS